MVPCQDAHLPNWQPEPQGNELAHAVVGVISHRWLSHGYRECLTPLLYPLASRPRRDEYFYIHYPLA